MCAIFVVVFANVVEAVVIKLLENIYCIDKFFSVLKLAPISQRKRKKGTREQKRNTKKQNFGASFLLIDTETKQNRSGKERN